MDLPNDSAARAVLEERINSKFRTTVETVDFGERTYEFTRVAEPEELLTDEVLAAEHTAVDFQPYWAEAWAGAYGLASYVIDLDLTDLDVMDLGCGMGISGAVAASVGARVVLGDYAPPALLFAELNCWPWRQRTTVRPIDWRHDNLGQRFDCIIGADILYDRREIPHLDAFWRAHLAEDAAVIHCDPYRTFTSDILDRIAAAGWQVRELAQVRGIDDETLRIMELKPR